MHHSRWLFLILLVTILLSGCTRDRATEEELVTPEVSAVDSVAQPVQGADPPITQVAPTPTTEATPTMTPMPESETIAYTVQTGDTISTIAEKYATDSETIRRLNFLTDNNILVGDILRIPLRAGVTAEGVATPTPEPFLYTVQSGDTLFSIALRFDVAANSLVAANTIINPDNLSAGTELVIPGYQPNSGSTSGGTAGAGSGASGAASSDNWATHVVRQGEGLYQIANQYGVEAQAIADANSMTDLNTLFVGQELIIPGVDAEVAGSQLHVVQAGEGLISIAGRYGISVDAIVEANKITNPNAIYVGQELIIPAN